MKNSFKGSITAERGQQGRIRDLKIIFEDGDSSRLSKNELWDKIKDLVGCQVQIEGSCYFLPNRDRVINAKHVTVLNTEKKVLLERIS